MVTPGVFNMVVYLRGDTATIAKRLRTLAGNAELDSGVRPDDRKALVKAADQAEWIENEIAAFAAEYGIG